MEIKNRLAKEAILIFNIHCNRQRELGALATIRSSYLSEIVFGYRKCIVSLFMHSLLFISPQNSVRRECEKPRKIFMGKFHRISYRREIQFNKRDERNSKTPCMAKCFINVELLKSLILKGKEGCYCKKEFNRTVNKNDEKKSKVYGIRADQYSFSCPAILIH